MRRAPTRSWGSVASVPFMRWLQAQGSSCRRDNARERRAAPLWRRLRSQPKLTSLGRGNVVVSLHLARPPSWAGPLGAAASPSRLSSSTAEPKRPPTRPCAWARRNSDQLRPIRRGAGPRPEARNTVATVVAETKIPSSSSSPWMRMYPQRGFSPCQPVDQAARLGRKGRTTRPARTASATSLQQSPVPAAKRLWAHRKAEPPLSREQPTGRSEQGTVGGRIPRPLPSSAEDHELVTQDDDLKLPLTTATGEEANNHAQKRVQHTHQLDAQSEQPGPRSPTRPSRSNRVSLPHRNRLGPKYSIKGRNRLIGTNRNQNGCSSPTCMPRLHVRQRRSRWALRIALRLGVVCATAGSVDRQLSSIAGRSNLYFRHPHARVAFMHRRGRQRADDGARYLRARGWRSGSGRRIGAPSI
jgi:hypothetical protein